MNNNFNNKPITSYGDERNTINESTTNVDYATNVDYTTNADCITSDYTTNDYINYIQSKICEHDFQTLYENLITARTGKLVDLYFDENNVLQSKDIMIDCSNKLVFYCECCDEERYFGENKNGTIASEPLIEFTYGNSDFKAEKENWFIDSAQYHISNLPSMYTSINSPNGTLKMISRVDKIQMSLKNYKGNNLPDGDILAFFRSNREFNIDKVNSSRNKMYRKINMIKSIVSYCMKYEDSFVYNYMEDSGWKIKMDLDTAIEVVHGVLREKSWESKKE